MIQVEAYININRKLGVRDEKIYGHFIEHFHRQIYGGFYDPGSPLANAMGFRTDVIEALKRIRTPVIRWPGGCFVSAYHWKDGVGKNRTPMFDKAWRVEEPNTFGTDEFIAFCRECGVEPYICTNAGTGTPEEMSDWVEYCNLENEGKWAKLRIENGHREPFRVRYWSIGNENYLGGEMGSKAASEWSRLVTESAKMMKSADPSIELFAASVPDLDWNIGLLREAGQYLDWISIHGYWYGGMPAENVSPYEECIGHAMAIEERILKTKYILGTLGYLGKIRIAFGEWNLRNWYHPNVRTAVNKEDYITPRNRNDINSTYTMADAVFTACFLNRCLEHCNIVGMANFSPIVNTRGAIFTHENGIVLRPTYFVFELYTQYMGDTVVDSWLPRNHTFEVTKRDGVTVQVSALDIIATTNEGKGDLRIAIVNRHPEEELSLQIDLQNSVDCPSAVLYSLVSHSKDSFNDIDNPHEVKISESKVKIGDKGGISLSIPPHSVHVLVMENPK